MKNTKTSLPQTFTTAILLGHLGITVSLPFFFWHALKPQHPAAKRGSDLYEVHIYFDTPTYDQVEKDVKVARNWNSLWTPAIEYFQVTLVAQLGLIGGTMGLFTGFSILSGIEIVYFFAKFLSRRKWACCKKEDSQDVWCFVIFMK